MSKEPKEDEQKTERFNMFMSPSEMKAIDDWAWANRIRSKSDAVRRLVQTALHVDGEIDEIHRRTIELNEILAAYADLMSQNIESEEKPDWEAIGKYCLVWTALMHKGFTELSHSIEYVTKQAHILRSDKDFSDLQKQTDEIAARAKEEAAKHQRTYFRRVKNDEGSK